jgi:MSHA biogenesis protein MshK
VFKGWQYRSYMAAVSCLFSASTLALEDPTKPPSFGVQQSKNIPYLLSSLLVSEDRKVAIINGQTVSEGERVDGATVISISKAVVWLNKKGGLIELKPKRASIRREK